MDRYRARRRTGRGVLPLNLDLAAVEDLLVNEKLIAPCIEHDCADRSAALERLIEELCAIVREG